MAIPDFQTLMLPIMEFMADQKEHRIREIAEFMAVKFGLTEEERRQLVPSGQQEVLVNRISWACSHLKKACLLETPQRGSWRIAPRGLETLASNPAKVNMGFLKQFPEYQFFRSSKKSPQGKQEDAEHNSSATPLEDLEAVYWKLREELASELLERIKSMPPLFFERLVIDLLLRMGYGGSRLDAGKAIGRSGDGGIDGIINEDKLGLDSIYIQAKRWEGTVSRPEVQKFAGALQGKRAKKGVFITTSEFSKEARTFVENIENRIVLIDGDQLAELMIDHDIGVTRVSSYEVKRVDGDYFTDE